jgi:hypothetical protein
MSWKSLAVGDLHGEPHSAVLATHSITNVSVSFCMLRISVRIESFSSCKVLGLFGPFPSGSPIKNRSCQIWRPGWPRKVSISGNQPSRKQLSEASHWFPCSVAGCTILLEPEAPFFIHRHALYCRFKECGDHCSVTVTCNRKCSAHFILKEVGTNHICWAYCTPNWHAQGAVVSHE